MDDFTGLFARDFGLKPQGKSAPMAPQTNSSAADFSSFASSYSYGNASSSPAGKKSDSLPVFDDLDRDGDDFLFKGVFSGPQKYGSSDSRSQPKPSAPAFDYDAMFKERTAPKSASMPVYDKPVYDDDIFEDIPELKSASTSQSARFEDVFSSVEKQKSSPLDDLMGKKETETKKTESEETGSSVFDDLIPGFGRSSSPSSSTSEPRNTSSRTVPCSTSPVYENPHMHRDSKSDGNFESSDDVWLTVSEIPLFTQPTSAPPPTRPPPPRPSRSIKKQVNEPSLSSPTSYSHVRSSARASANSPTAPQMDDFSVGRNQTAPNGHPEPADSDVFSTAVASAAAMKDAMDKAEAKFRHAKEMREKENLKASRGKEMENHDSRERELREKQMRLDREREEEMAKAQEREIEEKERERLLARQAVERATREARERAATEARAKVQRAAVGKATEDRERTERAAVQRAHAEARERAAAGAREKAEKAAAEAREKEAKARAERAAVERAAAEARGRATSQAKAKQQENNNDLDSFFNMGSRPGSAPRQRTNPPDPFHDSWNKGGSFESSRASSRGAANMVDDLSSIFGGSASQSGGFQEVEGESEERRRARLERDQRTQARAAKALAEKNERDLQVQREQAERNRIGETLDVEIKRWGAGKEGNLRALLSTLQYVLWPECGWQPVSLTDLITAASVKKFYRKATLCIHPDKVQQKGANLQQKYIAEKVFDLLQEAWNKLNSEELF